MNIDPMFYARMAMVLRIIDLSRYNIVADAVEGGGGRDSGEVMLEKGYITRDRLDELKDIAHTKSRCHARQKLEKDYYSERYTLHDTVGEGGVGRVYLGFDKNIERDVAIKELKVQTGLASNRRAFARFVAEAKITGQMEHPGVIPVYELGVKPNGTLYYVMKYVRGETLYEAIMACRGGSTEEEYGRRMAHLGSLIGVCDAMAYAHANGVIHRDLKPGNIVLGQFGETVILDWGIAKSKKRPQEFDDASGDASDVRFESAELTMQDRMLGTIHYMPPEQADASLGEADERSDVYALGSILFLLLTGKRMYSGSPDEIRDQLRSAAPSPSPRDVLPFVPPELAAICEKAVAKKRDDRFRNAGEFAGELKAYRDGRLVSVYAYSKKELFRRFMVRNKVKVVSAACVALSIIIGATFSIDFGIRAHRARLKAENALVDITGFTKGAVSLAREGVQGLEAYFSKVKGSYKEVDINDAVTSAFPVDPKSSSYYVWVMDQDGVILYDEDPNQVGRFLFSDAMYANFPELQKFAQEVIPEPSGVGYYSFHDPSGEHIVHKIAAWDTFKPADGIEWNVIVTYPYIVKKARY